MINTKDCVQSTNLVIIQHHIFVVVQEMEYGTEAKNRNEHLVGKMMLNFSNIQHTYTYITACCLK